MGADKGEYDNICPLDYAYSKYFLKHSIIIKSAISDFFFFEGEESFNREFDNFKAYVDDLLERASELRTQTLNEKGDGGK